MLKVIFILKKYWKHVLIAYVGMQVFRTFFGGSIFVPKTDVLSGLGSSEAQSIADSFYQATALHNAGWGGTDEAEIYALLERLKSQADFNKVYNVFGNRQYSPAFGNGGDSITSGKFNLIFILNNELNDTEKTFVRTEFPHLKIF